MRHAMQLAPSSVTLALALAGAAFLPAPASAQSDYQTYADSFAVPVFNSIDQNGVDLVTGTWRVRTPVIAIGSDGEQEVRGLEWTGQAWRHIGSPSLWRDDGKYIVQYKGRSFEFNGRSSNFSKRAPIDGSALECSGDLQTNIIAYCEFTSREGDIVHFTGIHTPPASDK